MAVMPLRHCTRSVSYHGTRVLTLGDNLSELCASEKGRASDRALRVLLQHALAYTLGPEVRWKRRYVESARNPSDHDSREIYRLRAAGLSHIGRPPEPDSRVRRSDIANPDLYCRTGPAAGRQGLVLQKPMPKDARGLKGEKRLLDQARRLGRRKETWRAIRSRRPVTRHSGPRQGRNGPREEPVSFPAELLAEIYGECASYFDAAPPKTTGREAMFSRAAFHRWHGRSQDLGMSADGFDLCATLTELTALTIAEACVRWAPTRLKDCVVSGGGARNPVLMGRLEHHLHRLAAARWGGCGSGAGGYGAGDWDDAEERGGELGGGGSNVGSGVCVVGTDANNGVGSGEEDLAVGCGGNHDESKASAMSPAGAAKRVQARTKGGNADMGANTVVGASTTTTSTTTSEGRRRPPRVSLLRHEKLGIDSDAKEAMVFALLGFLCIRGLPGNVPSCTGATRLCVLGKISPGANMAGLFGASVA